MPHKPTDIHQELLSIPVIQQAGLLSYQPLTTGSSNRNYHIRTNQGDWVVRFNRPNLGVDRTLEAQVLQLIAGLDVAPQVIENNPTVGYLITTFNPATVWQTQDFNNKEKLNGLQQQLAPLHAIEIDYPSSRLDIRTQHYIATIGTVPDTTVKQTMQVIEQLHELGFWAANRYLFHSDLNPSNLLGQPTPMIIDWEFAGQGHPLIDWLIIELLTGIDMSACYPKNTHTEWIAPCRQFLQLMLNIWHQHTQ